MKEVTIFCCFWRKNMGKTNARGKYFTSNCMSGF